ncbi:MAG: potassium channel protein [Synergistaceae bacterium]|nr:potassium channel protein [Synergistaceae bacterium]
MATKFTKTVKNAKRGIAFSKKFKYRLSGALILFLALLFSCALFVWWKEKDFTGSFWDSVWSVLFTLIGQGEFATSPHTFWGRIIVFLLSIFGVALFGVVFAEVLQRIINSRIKILLGEMMGINNCKFEGHVLICGWNGRGPYVVREFKASGRQMALIASERPKDLDSDIFFVQGNPSEREALIKGGVEKAQGAIILGDPNFGEDDSHTILTGLAVEAIAPNVYTVMELHNPENERYARYANVDDILYSDSLIANIAAMCTHNEGISAFIRDILSSADDGHSFASFDVPENFAGKTVGEVFDHFRANETLPIGIITPPDSPQKVPASEWISNVNPPLDKIVTLPMKVVCIVKDNYSEISK